MKLREELIRFLSNKLQNLNSQKSTAESVGDLTQIERLTTEIAEVESLLSELRAMG